MNAPWELIDAFLDGELTPGQETELRDWLNADRENVRVFVRATHLHRSLRTELLAQKVLFLERVLRPTTTEEFDEALVGTRSLSSSQPMGEQTQTAPRRVVPFPQSVTGRFIPTRGAILALAASIALVIGLSSWLFPHANNEPTLTVAMGTGVTLERDGQFFPVQHGLRLMPGDLLKTTTNGPTLITYGRETTRIVVASDTEVKFLNWKEGKRFDLRQGRIEATVAHQSRNHSMVWRTAQAEATVLGTELALEAATNRTTLEVLDGKVELSSRANGQVIQVTNSQYAVAAAGIELKAHQFPWGRGTILREYWLGIEGFHVGDLIGHARYPDNSSGSEYRDSFASPTNWGTNYGARFRGYLHPPRTGAYIFWITASESAQLWLSSDERADQVEMVTSLSQPARVEEWEKYPWQKSERIKLQAGRKYYIEALHKVEKPGGDHCSVAWQPPDGKREVIPGEFLSPFNAKK